MNRDEFVRAVNQTFPKAKAAADPINPDALRLDSSAVHEVCRWMRDDPGAQLTYFEFITAQDHPENGEIVLVYSLYSYTLSHRLMVKTVLDRKDPRIGTVSDIWEGADWSEREVYDLYGVVFENHPNLRRIMMYEGWEGYPLRKDYTHPNLIHRPE